LLAEEFQALGMPPSLAPPDANEHFISHWRTPANEAADAPSLSVPEAHNFD
jgi:hypothetical protein